VALDLLSFKDNLHHEFIADKGFGVEQIAIAAIGIGLSVWLGPQMSQLVGSAVGTTAGSGTMMAASATAGSMAGAGLGNVMLSGALTSMASSAVTGALSGELSFGSVFKAGLSAGLSAGLTNAPLFGGQSLNQLAGVNDVTGTGARLARFDFEALPQSLLGMAGRGVVNAGLQSALYGSGFGSALRAGFVSDLAAVGANAVGQTTDVLSVENIASHAGLGALAAKLKGQDALAGAVGGAAAAVVNPLIDPLTSTSNQTARTVEHTMISMLAAGLSAEALGRDGMVAAQTAQNETLNNWLFPKEKDLKWRAENACAAGQASSCEIGRLLAKLDASREATPSALFGQGFANSLVLAGGNALLMPVEITQAVLEGRGLDVLADTLKGIAGLPSHLAEALRSSDPAARGAAVAESLMLVGGAAALARQVAVARLASVNTLTAARVAEEAKVANNVYRDAAQFEYARAFEFKPGRTLAAEEANGRTLSYNNNALDPHPPYLEGTQVIDRLAQPGEKFYLIEFDRQGAPGGWATSTRYASLETARRELALLPEWKDGDLVVREYTVIKPAPVREGIAGPQTSNRGVTYHGGGKQVELVFDTKAEWSTYFSKPIEHEIR
jgi:hypothetical protein